MAMAHTYDPRRANRNSRRVAPKLALHVILFFAAITLACSYVAYILWPRWPVAPVAIDAPSVPVIVAGVTFNIPPAAIRQAVQRKPGVQERIDLSFLWPSLAAPDPAVKPLPVASSETMDRVFMTITGADGTLPPTERLQSIYPRYLDAIVGDGPGGLAVRPFSAGSPYQGEEIVYDIEGEGFVVRCTRNRESVLGMCLYDRRIGDADITIRFPRDWLEDWRNVAKAMDQLVVNLRAHGF